MNTTNRYGFRRATSNDRAMLMAWQALPHVREWWDSDEPNSEEEFADSRVSRWIVTLDEKPFAYIQDYTVHGWEGHHFFDFPHGSRGIDQFIGEADMIGRGHGSAFIAARMKQLFDEGVPVIGTDPHPDNARAIAVYKKVGFQVTGPPMETQWGLILPMQARP